MFHFLSAVGYICILSSIFLEPNFLLKELEDNKNNLRTLQTDLDAKHDDVRGKIKVLDKFDYSFWFTHFFLRTRFMYS